MPNENFAALRTENRNPNTVNIDRLPAADVVRLIHNEDHTVADAVDSQLDAIAKIAEMARDSILSGGRLIYMGAGTSGRLGVLDAAECRPTFGVPDGVVIGIIAGGERAMFQAVEGAEDSLTLGGDDLRALNAGPADTVVGIASSGRTPYVIGALTYAKQAGCKTASVSCVPGAAISALADVPVEAVTGPEALTGSTRMKAGSAQKMILNMISTSAFILCGKSWSNLMVDVKPTNDKLVARAVSIRFGTMLSNRGSIDGKRYLNRRTFELAIHNYTPGRNESRGLGFSLKDWDISASGEFTSPGSYGHNGYTGTSIYCDERTGVYMILLTNSVHYGRDNRGPFFRNRRIFHNLALTEADRALGLD